MAEDSVAQDQLQAFVRRIESVEDEIGALNSDKSEIYKEARGNGFDTKILRRVIAKRKIGASEREEQDTVFDLYWDAVHEAEKRLVRAHVENVEEFPPVVGGETYPKAKASEDDGATGQDIELPADSVTGDVTRLAAGRTVDAVEDIASTSNAGQQGGEQPESVTAGETATKFMQHHAHGDAKFRDPNDWEDEDTAPEPQPGKSVEASVSAAPAPIYAEPGVVTWESTPPEGVARSPYSNLFGTMGQDMAVIEDDLDAARSAPIVKIGNLIIDGWARYVKARSMFTELKVDGETKRVPLEYPVVQYAGTDPLMDCIRWNVEGRMMTAEQKFKVAQSLARMEPKRKADIYAAFELGMELVA